MRSTLAALVCLSCGGAAVSDAPRSTFSLPSASDGDSDADADADSDVPDDSGVAQEAPIAGEWAGLCEPSGTGTTPSTIVDLAVTLLLRESGGVVEGNGSLTLYSYNPPDSDSADSGGSPDGTVTAGNSVLVEGSWDGTTLTLGFAQPYYNDSYPLPLRIVGTVSGDTISAVLELYPDGDDTYASASWSCAFARR